MFLTSAILILLFVSFSALFTDTARRWFNTLYSSVTHGAGWFYVLVVTGFLLFALYLAFSRFGHIRLGPDDSRPDFGRASWLSMLFSAGIGIGLMFFGVAEPVTHYMQPPVGEGATPEAARQALQLTLLHWGLHGWAIYAVVGLSLAYFAFRHQLPLTIRSSLYPLLGDRIHGPLGHAADIFAVLGTLFGVATSLGLGVMQVNAGLNYLFGLPVSISAQLALIAGITFIATISVVLGLHAGIRRLSLLNMALAVALMLFVLVTGPTLHLLQALMQNTGQYFASLPELSLKLYVYEPNPDWLADWTLFYWGWWIAWAPFVGMFIARVSRGRSIREFILGVMFIPLGFTLMWMTFFGNTAIDMIAGQGITELAERVAEDSAVALFQFLEQLPFSAFLSLIATLLVISFFVTSSDSGSLVVDTLTSGGAMHPPTWQRVFWAVMEGLVAAVLLVAGGLSALQTAAVASALPFAIVMLLMCYGLLRALRQDSA